MPRLSLTFSLCLILITGVVRADDKLTRTKLDQQFAKHVLPFLKSHCYSCHGEKRQEAKLKLTNFRSTADVIHGHQVWELVLDRLSKKEMPPEKAKSQPSNADRAGIVSWIKNVRRFDAEQNAGDPGVVLVRRLSNAEYDNSVRDLTGVDMRPTRTFPVDPANEAGFDNSGESLAMSPALARKYLQAAREVANHMLLHPNGISFASHPVVTNTDRDKYCVKRIVDFYKQQPTDLAEYLFAAWEYRHRKLASTSLPEVAKRRRVSPKYLTTIWQFLNDDKDHVGPVADVRGAWRQFPKDAQQKESAMIASRQLRDDVLKLRKRLKPSFPNLEVPGSHKGSQTFVLWKNRQYVAHRRKYNSTALKVVKDRKPRNDLEIPADQRQRYEAAFARFADVFPDAFYISERGRDYLNKPREQQEKGRLLSAGFHSMMGYFRDDQPLYEMVLNRTQQRELDLLWQELDFITSAPLRQYTGFVWFERTDSRYMRDPIFDFARAEDKDVTSRSKIQRLSKVYLDKARKNRGGKRELDAIQVYFRNINAQIRKVESDRKAAEPKHLAAAMDFARRAFRRPLSEEERADWLSFYRSLRSEGVAHEPAMQDLIVSILMSPHFCYRLDFAGSGDGRRALTDFELASRLSYFLWATTPDERLLSLAAQGKLRRPDVLRAECRRMLEDPRVRGLAKEFAGNWLDFRRFEEHNSVDRKRFPTFTDDLRQAMFEEPIQFFVDVARNRRSVMELLSADHTFVNPTLAKHYGIPKGELKSAGWSRVDRAGRFGRGGLLPMSVFLTKNAPGLRTSPVKRGYWVVRRVLGEHIPPPPPNVPDLPDDEANLGDLTLSQVLAKHRDHKSCAGCHKRFDSIGLIFEGYGPIGEKRTKDLGGRPIVDKAQLPDGSYGTGLRGLKDYVSRKRSGDFVDNLSRKLLTFALGRSLLASDDALLRKTKSDLAAGDYRFDVLVEAIVTSPQFLNKRGSGTLVP